ncbi:dolichol kinase isoform X1 [Drosophila miranda]|uniref:dolichol kinase isoform X1 n=2 Tax=Drosophila miranda TaxID=7229 RepID=UPI0007E7EC8F|nr:dolichol kinase isoform X1 [Drosophila miranda]XP_017146468.1 dolichol kinase isoform X1 [Drosophila miranda]
MRRSISETEHSESDLSSGATTESNSSDYEQEDRHHSSRVHDSTTAKRDNVMLPRPWASSGGWMCFLMPLALASRFLNAPPCKEQVHLHLMLTVTAAGMCVETLCFFVYFFADTSILAKCIISLLPGTFTALGFGLCLGTSWLFAVVAGFLMIAGYQHFYVCMMRGFSRCFTYGEASILFQGLMLFVISATYRLYELCSADADAKTFSDFDRLNLIMLNALMWLLILCVLVTAVPRLRGPIPFYLLLGLLVVAVTCAPVTTPLPIVALLQFIFRDPKRLQIIGFYLVLVLLTGATVTWQLRHTVQANTRVRKIFHLLIVLVFVPGVLFQCTLLYLATGIALAAFVVLELMRLLEIPPFSDRLTDAFHSFRDEKDAGVLALTPFCLLIGCSMPLWLTPCPCSGKDTLILLSGILAVGVGDTAASVVGSKMGRNMWGNTSRSLEGTIAFVMSILLSVWLLEATGLLAMTQAKWFATIFAAINSALVEAFTDQVDNLVLPLVFYILVGLA